ncbi:MAG: UbiA family prenyltransferase [Verrucomicrobia bacterium]|nr:UbiA family prenyltransferase [Verrucomicrobiota bacterium]
MLILGRVSNLPTVWSNCLAGWWLGGAGNAGKLPLLFLGVSALYTGGMFLNDALDAPVDRQRRPSRPIPSGAITRESVLVWSIGLFAAGILALAFAGKTAAVLAVVLLGSIIAYDATHKAVNASPWLMGVCRFWVYVIAASAGRYGVNGWPIWCGMALASYIVGLSYVARRESFRAAVPWWPLILLAAPILLAMLMDDGPARRPAALLSIILALWVIRCVRTIFQRSEVNIGQIVSGLLVGIVFVDWLAVAPGCPTALSAAFCALFAATLVLQRFVPAT